MCVQYTNAYKFFLDRKCFVCYCYVYYATHRTHVHACVRGCVPTQETGDQLEQANPQTQCKINTHVLCLLDHSLAHARTLVRNENLLISPEARPNPNSSHPLGCSRIIYSTTYNTSIYVIYWRWIAGRGRIKNSNALWVFVCNMCKSMLCVGGIWIGGHSASAVVVGILAKPHSP